MNHSRRHGPRCWLTLLAAVALAHTWVLQHLPVQAAAVRRPAPVAAAPMQVRMAASPERQGAGARLPSTPRPRSAAMPLDQAVHPQPAALAGAEDPFAHYLANEVLDRRALPRSAPDTQAMEGAVLSGLPMRLRLFVNADGRVVQVLPMQAADQDADAVQRLQRMFLGTAFIPGHLGGRDVPAYLDIELGTEPAPVSLAEAGGEPTAH